MTSNRHLDQRLKVQHFRVGEPRLADLLGETLVLMHPFVLGELACGNLKNRPAIMRNLGALPTVAPGARFISLS